MARVTRLKVFEAQLGFHESVVAAPSQAAALRAWGMRQNLFAEGQARVTTDESAVKAALAHPETPLQRPVGSKDAFALASTTLPRVPDAPRPRKAKLAARSNLAAKSHPAPDRGALDAAERALRELDDAREREEADLTRRRDELDGRIARARDAYRRARKAAGVAVQAAQRAYRDAGGTA